MDATTKKKARGYQEIFPECVSIFPNAFADKPTDKVPIGGVLEAIRDGEWQKQVEVLRKRLDRGDQKGYDSAKRNLPAFTMSAWMYTRDKDLPEDQRVAEHSGFLQVDLDGKDNPGLGCLESKKWELMSDPYVAFAFVSPSGKGLKIGVRINPREHLKSFLAAQEHFRKQGLVMDASTKDPVRLCFVSYDPDLAINMGAEVIPIDNVDVERELQRPARGDYAPVPIKTTVEDIEEMLRYIPHRPTYEDWLRIASAVWSVLPMAEGCRVLMNWMPEERHGEYSEKWKRRLESIGIGTLAWYAQQGGFDARAAARRKVWAGRIRFSKPRVHRPEEEDFSKDPAQDVQVVELNREEVVKYFEDKQLGDAQLWAKLSKGKKLYDHLQKAWRTYHEGVWARDDMNQTLLDVPKTICGVYAELSESIDKDLIENPPAAKKDARTEMLNAISARMAKLRTTAYLSGVLQFAESLLGAKATQFDQHPHLICVKNGTIDLDLGTFREHLPEDMLTHKASCDFVADAECPRWLEFLDKCMCGNQEMIDYLARAVGYSLTGFVDFDVLFFNHGDGANGKSTFMAGQQMLLGEQMTTVPMDALLTKGSDATFDYRKAQMEGKRVVVTDEIPDNQKLNESAIKSLVGGDAITARRPYEKPYVFTPTHKLWLVGNHKPRIDGTDRGIWRRVHLIPWKATFSEEERRPRTEVLAEFREELPGILNWALLGWCDALERKGLAPPADVVEATKEYQSDSDQFAQFLADRIAENLVSSVSVKDIRESYEAWCEDEGELPRYRTNKKIATYFREHGYKTQVAGSKNILHVLGVEILSYE